ncbi:hypothetical protein [Arcticibacter eurypsychrophilus]|uniref:hypothetical protein n=1 Tax=Arcticibacter eurypsychrophilus TaxID=1434752 RepID=UPI00084D17F4|nr:hypothetical protein [Arcticibacter eurypsychrophilus]
MVTYNEHTGTYDIKDKVKLYRNTTIHIAEQDDLEFYLKSYLIISDNDFANDYEILEFNNNKDIVMHPTVLMTTIENYDHSTKTIESLIIVI